GRITFDGAALGRCMDGIAGSAQCDSQVDAFGSNSDCQMAFVGNQPIGGLCYDNSECAQGAYCTATAAACGGTCQTRKAIGAATTTGNDRECVNGAYNYAASSCRAP